MPITCPKCAYVRKPTDTSPEHECPHCGVIYAKVTDSAMPIRRIAVPDDSAAKKPTLCRECGGRISPRAEACPHCGDPRISKTTNTHADDIPSSISVHDINMPMLSMARFILKWTIASIPTAIMLAGIIYFATNRATRAPHQPTPTTERSVTPSRELSMPNRNLEDITRRVAIDAERQYAITERQGGAIDICVQAGHVAAAWLQAQHEANYQTWKQRERRACMAAGVPQG